jgi:hypothetical protein
MMAAAAPDCYLVVVVGADDRLPALVDVTVEAPAGLCGGGDDGGDGECGWHGHELVVAAGQPHGLQGKAESGCAPNYVARGHLTASRLEVRQTEQRLHVRESDGSVTQVLVNFPSHKIWMPAHARKASKGMARNIPSEPPNLQPFLLPWRR